MLQKLAQKIRKTLAYARISFKELLAYRFEVATWVFIGPISLAVYYFLWKAIYSYTGVDVIKGYTFNELISYYILIQLAGMFVWTALDSKISEFVRRGTLVVRLARPITLFKSMFLEEIGGLGFVAAVQAAPLLAIGAAFFGLKFTGWLPLTLAALSFALAVILNIIFVFFVGLSAFWVTRYSGIKHVRNGIVVFLGGGVIPLAYFPKIWQNIFNFLPFQYMLYVPIQIYLGKYVGLSALYVIAAQIFWIAFFYALIQLVWARAMAHFSAVGG